MKRGMVNSMRTTISTLNLEGLPVKVLGGLVASRPVPSIGEWVLCLLLLWDGDGLSFGDTSVGVGCEVCVCHFESVSSLDSSCGETAGGGSFLDEEKVEKCNKQDKGCE